MAPVSVIIPLHNKGAFVRRALESVLNQDVCGLEVIVVDDGSTDHGPRIVRACTDNRVRLISQAQAGPGAARNRGIRSSRGNWVALLDADDWWEPGFLAALFRAVQEFPDAGVVFTNNFRTSTRKPVYSGPGSRNLLIRDYFSFCLQNKGCGMFSSAMAARRDALLEVGLFPVDRFMGEDLDTWARLAWHSRIVFVPQPLATYDDNTVGLCSERLLNCDIWNTYRHWLREGRIPAHLKCSSRSYAALLRFKTATAWLRAGFRAEAWQLVSEMPRRQLVTREGLWFLAIATIRWLRGQRVQSPRLRTSVATGLQPISEESNRSAGACAPEPIRPLRPGAGCRPAASSESARK